MSPKVWSAPRKEGIFPISILPFIPHFFHGIRSSIGIFPNPEALWYSRQNISKEYQSRSGSSGIWSWMEAVWFRYLFRRRV